MNFTTGEDVFYERLMKQVPNFDKTPADPEEMELDCELCVHYRKKLKKCRLNKCPYKDTDKQC